MTFKHSIILATLFSIIMSSCDDTTDLGNSISGTVTDVNTDQPIAGVVISLLEGGPETVSDQNGTFS